MPFTTSGWRQGLVPCATPSACSGLLAGKGFQAGYPTMVCFGDGVCQYELV